MVSSLVSIFQFNPDHFVTAGLHDFHDKIFRYIIWYTLFLLMENSGNYLLA